LQEVIETMFFDGLLDLSAWGYVVAALLMTHVTIASVTIFLHRHQAHRALTLHPAVSHFFRFWLWLTTGMVTREWAAIHRKHHAKCETEEDPHSPQQSGIGMVLFAGAWLYRKEALNPETLEAYGHGTPDDWIERHVYSRYRFKGIGLMLLLDLLLFGAVGFGIWLVQMIWIPFWAAGVINGIGHYWGYRNFETQDASRNIVPWGILIGGEELHNNHHAYGVSAKLSNKWWEFDIGWLYIRILELLKLAKVRRTAPKVSFEAIDHRVVDIDMLKAVVTNRFHVLKLYGSRVVRPVLRAQRRQVSGEPLRRLRRAYKLIASEATIALDAKAMARLTEALEANHTLQTIYDFKQRLKGLWNQHNKEQIEPLARLQTWCADAEASGIAALQEFARQLRGYRSQLA
jgi:stearoyl-CoA desaturase (delta-9 desaturase)